MSIVERAMEKLERAADRREADSDEHTSEGEAPEPRAVTRELRPPSRRGLAKSSRRGSTLPMGPHIEIDYARLREAGLLPPESQANRLAEEYRRIKRPLLANAFGKSAARVENGNLIMIASSLPGEGKSFTAVNLALSVARELDNTVLLVDADVAKPHITRELGLEQRVGLLDVLLDETIDLQDALVATDIDCLRVLPAGAHHEQSTELFASERMERLLGELANRYADRVILFDSPPLLATTEAQVMASHMGQILLVVNAGVTSQHAVLQSLETLDPARTVNLVLNQVRAHADGEGYYGSYGYYVE